MSGQWEATGQRTVLSVHPSFRCQLNGRHNADAKCVATSFFLLSDRDEKVCPVHLAAPCGSGSWSQPYGDNWLVNELQMSSKLLGIYEKRPGLSKKN